MAKQSIMRGISPALFIVAITAGALYGQTSVGSQASTERPSHLVFSPLPAWPSDGSIPTNVGAGACFDFKQLQVVLLVPSPASASGVTQVRYDVPNGTNTSVTFSVAPAQDGQILCSYLLNDGPLARQRSRRFALLVPSHDSGLACVAGSWTTGTEPTAFPDRTSTVAFATMRMAYWSDPAPTNDKVSGLPITATSTYLPGFVDAYVEGYVPNPLTLQAISGIPNILAAEAGKFLQPGIGSAAQIVIGPLFRPGADKLVIAANYAYGVQSLTNASKLNAKSVYVGALLNSLNAFLQTGGSGEFTAPAASGPVETAIQQAVSLAFQ